MLGRCGVAPIRHAATEASLSVVTSLCTMCAAIRSRSASQKRRSTESLADSEFITMADGFIANLFDAVFAHRYRDVFPAIRASCVSALAKWAVSFPEKFLVNKGLKYLGWALSDRKSEVRSAALLGLTELYDPSRKESLRDFNDRFIPRIASMSMDDEARVSSSAVSLLGQIEKMYGVSDDITEGVIPLMAEVAPAIRSEAARYIVQTVVEAVMTAEYEENQSRRIVGAGVILTGSPQNTPLGAARWLRCCWSSWGSTLRTTSAWTTSWTHFGRTWTSCPSGTPSAA